MEHMIKTTLNYTYLNQVSPATSSVNGT